MLLCWRAKATLLVLISWNSASGFHSGGLVNRGSGGGTGASLARQLQSNNRRSLSLSRVAFTAGSSSRERRGMEGEEHGAAAGAAGATAAAAGAAVVDVGGDDAGGGKGTPLFVYGTLMNDKVLFALLGRVPPTQKAQLSGYHRYQIRDHVFPAVRPKEGNSVAGLFMEGLDARERLIFDLFEDDDYHKVDVEVEVDGLEGATTATAYVWNASAEDQLYGTWEPATHFADSGPVPDYVAMVQRFARHLDEEGLLDVEKVT